MSGQHSNSNSKSKMSPQQSSVLLTQQATYVFYLIAAYYIVKSAYRIRMVAIDEFGPVIHEFDPYFNFRATEYLYWNGWRRFFRWFDHDVWYPLGRPVGTTIYPGMQFTAVFIKSYVLPSWSLNDVCCYMPAWFGVVATTMTGLIAYECVDRRARSLWTLLNEFLLGNNNNNNGHSAMVASLPKRPAPAIMCGVCAAAMMAIVPAHLMRSMGGGYDNESVANTTMVLTFYCWIKSLNNGNGGRLSHTVLWSVLTGLSYFYMVATWGGYVFVLNLIAIHAMFLAVRFSTKLYLAYTMFYMIGTTLAVQIPVVGWAPLKSLEQLGALAVFAAYQVMFASDNLVRIMGRKDRTTRRVSLVQLWQYRCLALAGAGVLAGLLVYLFLPASYFGPISSRVRGLFVKHTKTGNPLVDSVAEHQPASSRAYFQYLHHVCSLAPIGYVMTIVLGLTDSSSFLLVWGAAAYFFSNKMVRLILLTAPIGSILGGIAAGRLFAWAMAQWTDDDSNAPDATTTTRTESGSEAVNGSGGNSSPLRPPKAALKSKKVANKSTNRSLNTVRSHMKAFRASKEGIIAQRIASVVIIVSSYMLSSSYISYCWRLSQDLSNPSIIVKARLRDGRVVKLDDYREAYWWLRDNTPKDARVMAWWDYGYQISAIANRTTIADGNTWNHEHIALLGKALTTDLEQGWEIARHLADYFLLWGGGGGDDLAKSPHLARIANSVYRDHCPDDPTCRAFGFVDRQGTPSDMMRRSLLYNLHGHQIKPGVEVSADRFVEVYRSKYGKVRIYKISGVSEESKKWIAENYECDAEGSWFCPGKYPPGLKPFLDTKKDFRQLEDFNRQDRDDEYQKKYFENLQNPEAARRAALERDRQSQQQPPPPKAKVAATPPLPPMEIDEQELARRKDRMYNTWEDSDATTRMWQIISDGRINDLQKWLTVAPEVAFLRSLDGRGPMFWAYEQRNEDITKILLKAGVPNTDRDAQGKTPVDLLD